MRTLISITAISSISPLGESIENAWKKYQDNNHYFTEEKFGKIIALVAKIPKEAKKEIEALRQSDSKYRKLDNSVLFAIYTARKAIKQANWNPSSNFGINIGSSRGATSLFEKYHEDFLKNGKTTTLSSPTTTLGNISSWVAHDLQTKGPEISHSITCSTAMHAILNGVAWLQSNMASKFLVGGSESPLTSFTIAQIQALKVYATKKTSIQDNDFNFPCKSLDLNKERNTMILSEAASVTCLEKGRKTNALAIIESVGYATEILSHNASLSTDAICFQRSMKMALKEMNTKEIDIIVTHTPGTIKGDRAEYKAIEKVFGDNMPFLTTNKWKLGHTFATSGMLNIEMAILMLQHQKCITIPFIEHPKHPKKINKILVNAVGFGGNAVSILLSK